MDQASYSALDGGISTPSFTFHDKTNTGFYRDSAGRMAFVVAGVEILKIGASGITPSAMAGALVITAAVADALAVGRQGATNPVLSVDASVASVVTGLLITGKAAASRLLLAVTSSGADEGLDIDAKGTGTIRLGNTSTGDVVASRNLTVAGTVTVTSTSASALTVGRLGATTPVLKVDASAATVVTGLSVTGSAAGSRLLLAVISSGADEGLDIDAKGTGTIRLGNTSTGDVVSSRSVTVAGTVTITSAGAAAFTAGRLGATTPVLTVDASTATVVTGLLVKGAAAAARLALSVTSSGADEGLDIDAKGTGTIRLGNTSTGDVVASRNLTVAGTVIVTSAGAAALAVGRLGATTPVLAIDASAATVVTGLLITGKAAASRLLLAVTSSGADEGLDIDAKGTGTIRLGAASTGNIVASRAIVGDLGITSIGPTAGIGYATGAGGTVTQTVSRSTGVTLSKVSGAITTDTTSLAAEASAVFTVTNTAVAIGDTVILCQRSGSNGGNTLVGVYAVAAGSFDIRVFNQNAAGGAAETGAIVINFAVIKAVSA